MSISYTCPNPDCGVTLKTPTRVAVGKSVKCPKCGRSFVAEKDGAAAHGGDNPSKPAAAAAGGPGAYPRLVEEEESQESINRGYGVVKESAAEVKETKKNRPKFTEVQDKFKKSARGPAQGLLVMPSNLLVGAGLILAAASIVYFVIGMWPLVFNDAPPGEEELDEAVFGMLMGVLGFIWAAIICYGASQMQELGSYIFAWLGAIMAVPLLVGIFGVIMLLNPKVKAGFEEAAAGPDELEDDEDDEDGATAGDDDDDDGGAPAAKKRKKKESDGSRRAKKAAGMLGGMLLGAIMGDEEGDDGGDDYDDESEGDDEADDDGDDDEFEDEPQEEGEGEFDEEDDDDGESRRKKKRR
jgi:hypothetical protein